MSFAIGKNVGSRILESGWKWRVHSLNYQEERWTFEVPKTARGIFLFIFHLDLGPSFPPSLAFFCFCCIISASLKKKRWNQDKTFFRQKKHFTFCSLDWIHNDTPCAKITTYARMQWNKEFTSVSEQQQTVHHRSSSLSSFLLVFLRASGVQAHVGYLLHHRDTRQAEQR